MTLNEFSREFNILYDNIASNGAPGLNEYEKSVFLTQAQDELIKENYSPFNQFQKGFESNENRRTELGELVKSYSNSSPIINSQIAIDENSKFFEIPEEVYYILQEEVVLNSSDSCVNGKIVSVVPTTHDDYNVQKKSPFRKPNKNRVWRFNVSKLNSTKVVELISPYDIGKYKMRYLKKPKPIILVNFESDPELTGLGLTIEGLNVQTECELYDEFHRNILNRAVELSIKTYRENTLQNNVEFNKRNV